VANLRKVAAVAAGLARDGRLSLDEVVEALRQDRIPDMESDSPLADDQAEAVRVQTIHKVKGLENRVVFLADLARGRNETKDAYVARVAAGPDRRQALALRAGKDCWSSARAWLDEENRRHEEAENLRLLYVAATRARERLVVIATPPKSRGIGWLEALDAWGYTVADPPDEGPLADGHVLHRKVPVPERVKRKESVADDDLAAAVERYRAAADLAARLATRPFRPASGEREDEPDRAGPGSPGGGPADEARAVGAVMHRVLERWDGRERERLTESLAEICESVAVAEGVDPALLRQEASKILETFLGSPLADRFASVDRIGRELPLLLRDDDGAVIRGRIDLVYRDAEGTIVVADYKTDRDADPDLLAARHGPQLRVYGKAVRDALGLDEPPRTELWLLRHGTTVVADP
jgi:ATP-dependent exoDNAse (exonuclease V) beta subunit